MKQLILYIAFIFSVLNVFGQSKYENKINPQTGKFDMVWRSTAIATVARDSNKISDLAAIASISSTTLFRVATGTLDLKGTGAQLLTFIASDSANHFYKPKPAGGSYNIQYNNAGTQAGDNYFNWNPTTNKLGINSWNTNPLHGLTLIADSGIATTGVLTWKYVYNITDPNFNKNRLTIAQATDTLSKSIWITNSGKWQIKITDKTGALVYILDTNHRVGINTLITTTYDLNVGVNGIYSAGSLRATNIGTVSSSGIISSGDNIYAGAPPSGSVNKAASVGNNYSRNSAGAGVDFTVISNSCLSGGTNLNPGNIHIKTNIGTGSGSGYIDFLTTGGGLLNGTTDLSSSRKMYLGGVGELVYTPLNTTLTGADSIVVTAGIAVTINLIATTTVSAKGARVLCWNGLVNATALDALAIDTAYATKGQIIEFNNTSPTSKTWTFNNAGVTRLNGTTAFVLSPLDAIQFECVVWNNKKYWRENWRVDVTP